MHEIDKFDMSETVTEHSQEAEEHSQEAEDVKVTESEEEAEDVTVTESEEEAEGAEAAEQAGEEVGEKAGEESRENAEEAREEAGEKAEEAGEEAEEAGVKAEEAGEEVGEDFFAEVWVKQKLNKGGYFGFESLASDVKEIVDLDPHELIKCFNALPTRRQQNQMERRIPALKVLQKKESRDRKHR